MNGSLVFHLVNVNPGIGPFATVVGNVCLDSLFQLFDDFQGRTVGYHDCGTLPPDRYKHRKKYQSKSDKHGITTAHVVNELGAGQKRVGHNNFLAINSAEGRRKQPELLDE